MDPLNEWFGLKVGVTRTNAPDAGAQYAGRLGDDPGLSRETAVRAITFNSSYALHQEAAIGSLEVGKQADVIVLGVPDYRHLGYRFGPNLVESVIKKGKIVWNW